MPPSEALGVTALNPGACALFIIVGFTCAGGAHVIWLRSSFSRRFAVPIDLGVTLRGHRLFGDNKMWRGFLVIIPAAAASFFVLSQILRGVGHSSLGLWPLGPAAYAGLGAWTALGFMIGELPNSFAKRQLGVPPGGTAPGRMGLLFRLADRLDSVLGVLIALALVVPVPVDTWAYILLAGPIIHLGFSASLYLVGVKPRVA